jgi:ssDNA-binding Zn-finger/Zn-ribbon topoisomerase 1
MISRQSTKDGRKYWGCRNYPACKQTFASTASVPA